MLSLAFDTLPPESATSSPTLSPDSSSNQRRLSPRKQSVHFTAPDKQCSTHTNHSFTPSCGIHCSQLHRSFVSNLFYTVLTIIYSILEVVLMPFLYLIDITVTHDQHSLTLREAYIRAYSYYWAYITPIFLLQVIQPIWYKHLFGWFCGWWQSAFWNLWPVKIKAPDFTAYVYDNRKHIHRRVKDKEIYYLLYCHGGGYIAGNAQQYPASYDHILRSFAAENLPMRIVSLAYTLVDVQAKYSGLLNAQAINEGIALYDYLLNELHVDSNRIAIAGDSAGGNLACVLNLVIRDTNRPRCNCAVLFSPWVDVGLDLLPKDAECRDIFHSRFMYGWTSWHQSMNINHKHPYLSPLHADLHDLPPIYLHYAQRELFAKSNAAFQKKLADAGVLDRVFTCPVTFHVAPLLFDWTGRRSKEHLQLITEWLIEKMTHPQTHPSFRATDKQSAMDAVNHDKQLIQHAFEHPDRENDTETEDEQHQVVA